MSRVLVLPPTGSINPLKPAVLPAAVCMTLLDNVSCSVTSEDW